MPYAAHATYTRSAKNSLRAILVAVATFLSPIGAQAENQALSISGNHFVKDGKQWWPKGVTVEGFNEPPTLRAKNKMALEARNYWGDQEINAIKSVFGADIARFNVSQPGLDPKSSIHDPSYRDELLAAFKQARAAGLVVIVSMDAQAENGVKDLPCMPDDSTVRAWKELAPPLAHDPGVMFELYNEPCGSTKPEDRAKWVSGMQDAIDALRQLGAKNILLADGLHFGRTISGLPGLLHDPVPNHLAMAVHPYLSKGWYVAEGQWDKEFGGVAAKYPVIVSEWNATPTNGCIDAATPALSLRLMRYLQTKNIGLIVWAIDSHSGKLVKDHSGYQPTNYQGFAGCNDGSDSGGGELMVKFPHN